jgi:hypothetical protein
MHLGRIGVAAAVAWLVVRPLPDLGAYYQAAERRLSAVGRTNAPIFGAVEHIRAQRGGVDRAIVDRPPHETEVRWDGGGRVSMVFRMALALEGVPFREFDLRKDDLLDPKNRCRDQLVVIALREPDTRRSIVARLGLREVDPQGSRLQAGARAYPIYHLPRLPTSSSTC